MLPSIREKVAVIDMGEWGRMDRRRGDYDGFAESIGRTFADATAQTDSVESPMADVKVVTNVDEAHSWLEGRGIAVFISRGVITTAKMFAAAHPKTRVVLLTGLIPDGEVVFVNKLWFDPQLVEHMLKHPS